MTMKLRPAFLVALTLSALPLLARPVHGQDAQREVRAVIDRIFDGMRAADTVAIRSTFHPEFRLAITAFRDGDPVMNLVSGDQFIASIARATEKLDERIADVEIRVDDNLAMVWNRYVFYVGDRLDHCGVDAFTLVRTTDGWKILQVADTQRRDGCLPFHN